MVSFILHFLFLSGNAEKMSSLFSPLLTVKPLSSSLLKTTGLSGILVYIHSNPRAQASTTLNVA